MDFKTRVYRLLGSSCLSLMTPLLAAGAGCTVTDEDADVPSVVAPPDEVDAPPDEADAPLDEVEAPDEVDAPPDEADAPPDEVDAPPDEADAPPESAACQVPGTLAYHVAQASALGNFDYDPPGGLVVRVKGRYRADAWRFRWKERFVDGSYLDQRVVRGQAAVLGDDQILSYRIETTDVLGAVSLTEVEESWDGCTVDRQFRAQGEAQWRNHQGSYDGTTYTYFEEQVPYRSAGHLSIIQVYGERYADQSFVEYFEGGGYPHGPEYYQTRTGDGFGNESLSWTIDYGDGYINGTVESSVDGTRHHFTRSLSDGDGCTETWRDQTIAYDGHGSGTSQICDFSNDNEYGQAVSCTLAITPEQCVQTCANGAVNVYPSCL